MAEPILPVDSQSLLNRNRNLPFLVSP
jgi:hypothetical protein